MMKKAYPIAFEYTFIGILELVTFRAVADHIVAVPILYSSDSAAVKL